MIKTLFVSILVALSINGYSQISKSAIEARETFLSFTGNDRINLPEQFNFDQSATIQFVRNTRGIESDQSFYFNFHSVEPFVSIKGKTDKTDNLLIMVYNTKEDYFFSLFPNIKGEKIATSLKTPKTKMVPEAQAPTFDKTEMTRKIFGYTCYRHIAPYEGGIVEAWIADDDDIQMREILNAYREVKGNEFPSVEILPIGLVLQATYYSETGDIDMFKVKELSGLDTQSLSLEGYEFRNISEHIDAWIK